MRACRPFSPSCAGLAGRVLMALLLLSPGALGGGRNPARTTAQTLVDLALDLGASKRGEQTEADARQVQVLLEAAQRLDPNNLDAAYWLYEFATLKQDPAQIRPRLEKLRAIAPENETVFARWLDLGPAGLRRAEERIQWLANLERTERKLAPPQTAQIHVRRARLLLERMDRDGAEREQQAAVAAFPACPDAALLGIELLSDDAPATEFLAAALQALRLNPAQAELAWRIGLILDDVGLAADARTFYEHALGTTVDRLIARALPGERWVQLARNALLRGNQEESVKYADAALDDLPDALPDILTLDWILQRQGRLAAEKQVIERVKKKFATVRAAGEWPLPVVNEAAWVAITLDPQPQRALALAQALTAAEPGNPKFQRTLGWALALNQQNDEARRVLTPLAAKDAYAACRLAQLAMEAGDEEEARRNIQQIKNLPASGPLRDLVAALKLGGAESAPTSSPAGQAAIRDLLEHFDAQPLEFRKTPEKFIEATVTPEDVNPAVGEPWWFIFALTNHGSSPVVLGPNGDLSPQMLVSLEVEGEKKSSIANLAVVALDAVQVLMPGQTVSVRRTLDIGPARRANQRYPQTLLRVVVSVLVDPVEMPNGEWRPAPGGQVLRSVYMTRLPISADGNSLRALNQTLHEEGPARFRALDALAQLLAEQQRAAAGSAGYRVQPAQADLMRAGLLDALRSPDWELRARALDSLQASGLDEEMLTAARESLTHSHWLVRIMAARLVARQGPAVAADLKVMAEKDEDALVRSAADCLLAGINAKAPAASQPKASTDK